MEESSTIKTTVIITLVFAVVNTVKLIGLYILTSKWICCSGGPKSIVDLVISCFTRDKYGVTSANCANSSVNDDRRGPLCSSKSLVATVEILHVISKLGIIGANIAYLFIVPSPDKNPLSNPERQTGRQIAYFITWIGSIYECAVIFFIPVYILILTVCFKPCLDLKLSGFWGYVKYGDLQFALTFAPFINVYLHYIGGLYWVFIVVRVLFYCITFVSVIIVGIRFFLAVCCIKCVDIACCSKGEAVEIRDCKHLIKEVGVQLFSITMNLVTAASALATYFKIAVLQTDPVRYAYLAFTLLSCLNAIAATFYNAVLLRWVVLKEDEKTDDSIGSRALNVLKFKAPSSHIAFVIGIIVHFGLIGLNSYILHSGRLE